MYTIFGLLQLVQLIDINGTADISPCEHPTTQHPALRPTTPSTTTTAPPSTTTTKTATREPPTFYPYGDDAFEDDEATWRRHFEEHTTAVPPALEEDHDEDDVIYLREPFNPLGEEPVYTNLSRNETYEDGEGDSDVKESDDDEPWWRRLVYILGDYKRIPLLLIFLVVFCVGAGMGSVATIICEQHCCCRDDGHHSNKSSDYDGEDEFRHFSRTDFTRPSANATFVGPVDGSINSGRLSKENISHPLPPGGSRSPGSDTYHTPYHHQQRYLSNSADETLPLNMPLPQDNQRVKNGAYNQFNKYQDTYQ
ncbi:uncharacterized protein [Palaemon carinicauda]|uniref:uncharacterized protein n=1 Tax=Palaemon carinicauda TaxID=392227 RepID=UPI0035B5C598